MRSPSRSFATWIAFAWVLLATSAGAQSVVERLVSPGALSSPHAKFEQTCNSCHLAFDRSSQNKLCLDCHKPVAADISGRKGFHGRDAKASSGECRTCHTDHKGRTFAIVKEPGQGFDHNETDYPLRDKHAKLACGACHAAGKPFRAAPVACAGCHLKNDVHKGALGKDCAACHDEKGWKAERFDHAKTKFPLTGAHIKATCQSCHADKTFAGSPIPCASCHAKNDVHKGSLGPKCADCHTTSNWQEPARFDHAKTGFPLLGAHAKADCSDCHQGGRYKEAKPACVSCHLKDDAHKGGFGVACADCHSARDWRVTRFDHAKTGFALTGKHGPLQCQACHAPGPSIVKDDHQPAKDCNGCHAKDDKHKGLNGTGCADCHSTATWKSAAFDHNKQTKFPLEGAHAKTACATCHVRPADQVRLSMDCASCHAKDDKHAGQLGKDCATCHGVSDWKSALRFDHDLAPFPLVGKHAGLACAQCHASPRFKDAPIACKGCHARIDPHKGAYGDRCESCHNAADWKTTSFDHDKTRFPLTGRHLKAVCADCHKPGRPKAVASCLSCHQSDDVHDGAFGGECQTCHSTTSFAGAFVTRAQ